MGRLTLGVFCLFLAALAILQISIRVWPELSDPTRAYTSGVEDGLDPGRTAKQAQVNGTGVMVFPRLSGRVIDNASMLTEAEEAGLVKKLEAFEERASDQIVVATLVDLNGNSLEDYANRLFRHWQLGQAGENNGVLLLVVRDERKIRIEVGYGLEATLTDALSKLIIDQIIVPAFRQGNFGQGIIEGTDMIMNVLSGDLAELEARKNRNPGTSSDTVDWEFWIFILIWGALFFGPLGFSILAPIYGEKLGKHRYRWLGLEVDTRPGRKGSSSGGWSSGSGWSGGSSGGGFSGGGGSSGGGGASGGW